MHLKILDPCYDEFYVPFQYFFDLNGDDYIFISDKEYRDTVDILICNHFYHPEFLPISHEIIKKYSHRCSFFMDIKHSYENSIANLHKDMPHSLHDYTISNAMDPGINDSRIIFNDHLFNRTKAYYQGYKWSPDSSPWYQDTTSNYMIPSWIDGGMKTKIFVAPNQTAGGPRKYRLMLVEKIREKYLGYGHLGAFNINPKLKLYSYSDAPEANSVTDLVSVDRPYKHRGYSPPHPEYYKDTFISIYSETIEYGNTLAVTEKTFDPLIKGHFILPFSTKGFVKLLKTFYGFRMPDFVDYSYDDIDDDDARFQCYINEVERLMMLSNWSDLWNSNRLIIEHNQNIFHDRPYHRIDFSQYLP